MPRTAAALVLITVLLGCDEESAGRPDAAASVVEDAAPRVLERTVRVEMVPPATRELTVGPGGELEYGELMPLTGARVCATERRAAFALFEPFEAIDDPICETSDGGPLFLDDLPADSDLVVTVTHEELGLVPVVSTLRTDERDSTWPDFTPRGLFLTLLTPDATAPWLERTPADAPGQGLVSIEVWVNFPFVEPVPDAGVFLGGVSGARPGEGFELRLDVDGEGAPLELVAGEGRPRFLRAPAGSATLEITPHDGVNCRSCGLFANIPRGGFPTQVGRVLELPIREGYRTAACYECWCLSPEGARLVDADRCAFDDASEDAGVP